MQNATKNICSIVLVRLQQSRWQRKTFNFNDENFEKRETENPMIEMIEDDGKGKGKDKEKTEEESIAKLG